MYGKFIFWLLGLFVFAGPGYGQDSLQRVIQTYHELSPGPEKVQLAMDISLGIHRKNHQKKLEYEFANQAVSLARDMADTLLYSLALNNLGLLFRYHEDYGEAINYHTEAFHLIRDRPVKPLYKMISANNAGVAARYNQEYDLAIQYYLEALLIAKQENDLQNIAISSNGIGNSLIYISGREEEALAYFRESLAAESQRDNPLGIAMNYLSISDYYIHKRLFGTARSYLSRLLDLNSSRGDAYGLAITYQFFGLSYLKEGADMRRAISYFKNSLQRFEALNQGSKQAELLNNLGEAYYRLDRLDSARDHYLRSLKLSEGSNDYSLLFDNSLQLSKIYESLGNPARALRYLKVARENENALKIHDQHVKIAATIRKYDLESKENRIKLLEKDQDLRNNLVETQNQVLRRRRITILLLTTGLVSILVIVFLQYRNHKVNKRHEALIQKEEKEKLKAIYEKNMAQSEILMTRLQINPHFIFNSLNAIKYLIQSGQNQKAMKYLVVFSRYTRIVLETSSKNVVSLAEELTLTNYYLALEENRFENDFTFFIEDYAEDELSNIYLPPMLLQPFIENAIWHGLLPSKKKRKTLTLSIKPASDVVQIIIDDNGVGRKVDKKPNGAETEKSMGMKITLDRIKLFNDTNRCKIECNVMDKVDDDGNPLGTTVILSLLQTGDCQPVTDGDIANSNEEVGFNS